MRSPPLSPSQRAYTFGRDKFLAGIAERAARLYEDGYAVEPGERCHEFLVTPPNTTIPYVVNALRQTCTCCFHRRQVQGEPLTRDGSVVPCKHLQGLQGLIRSERRRLQEEERWCCYFRLRIHWLQTLADRWQEEQRRQEQEAAQDKAACSPPPLCRHCAAQPAPCDARQKGERSHEPGRGS